MNATEALFFALNVCIRFIHELKEKNLPTCEHYLTRTHYAENYFYWARSQLLEPLTIDAL